MKGNYSKKSIRSYLAHLPRLNIREANYIAGFMDADGSIMIQRINEKRFRLQANISNRNLAVLQWIKSKCGDLGYIEIRRHDLKNDKWACAYALGLSSTIAEWLLRQIEPFMIVKREQALLAFRFCHLRNQTYFGGAKGAKIYHDLFPQFAEIYKRVQTLNKRGISYRTSKKQAGELQKNPNSSAVGNLQPSHPKVRNLFDWMEGSEANRRGSTANKTNTSARRETDDMVRTCGKP